jgi:hypothetical protein
MENTQRVLKEARENNLVKFEESGSKLSGLFFNIEESKSSNFPNSKSYLVSVKKDDGQIYSVFVTDIAKRLFDSAEIKKGQYIELIYTGKQKTEDKKRDYHTYKLMYE